MNWSHFHCALGALVGLGSPKGLSTAASRFPVLRSRRPQVKGEQLCFGLVCWALLAASSKPSRSNSNPI